MLHTTRQISLIALLGLSFMVVLPAGKATAQATADRTAGTSTGTATGSMNDSAGTTTRTTRDEGFNPGWLGLLGLAGLAGLMPKKVQHVATMTTHRPSDTTNR